tara:strand:- start:1473 stop:1715 length:243 start_codon:yes stop_codon:yes gene_type:complete
MAPKNKEFDIDEYREHIVTSLAILKQDVRNTKERMVELTGYLREQNGRVRKNEKNIARIFGIGSTVMAGFSAIIGWLFNK